VLVHERMPGFFSLLKVRDSTLSGQVLESLRSDRESKEQSGESGAESPGKLSLPKEFVAHVVFMDLKIIFGQKCNPRMSAWSLL
jgi:hypothetical protein